MINLLRRIRRNMMTEKKSDLYLVYAIGEVVLVVLGILIALQIDNWNEDKKERSIEQQYLLALKEEFEFNKGELSSVMNGNRSYVDNALIISDHTGPDKPEISNEDFQDLAMGAFASEVHYNPNQGVLDEIISSGKLGIFNNDELKLALSSWSAVIDRALWQERTHELLRVQIVEITRANGNMRSMTYKLGERYNIKPNKFKRDNLFLLNSEEFDNRLVAFILTGRILNETHYTRVDKEIERILELINKEID